MFWKPHVLCSLRILSKKLALMGRGISPLQSPLLFQGTQQTSRERQGMPFCSDDYK